jgi:hypothetical protein
LIGRGCDATPLVETGLALQKPHARFGVTDGFTPFVNACDQQL